ncbi:hypothetical protein PQX77_014183 [Marasmius sp. AFHP31]|nr:hypothetical protein PQX77_014183 [Marasmius sp. AFHP31]
MRSSTRPVRLFKLYFPNSPEAFLKAVRISTTEERRYLKEDMVTLVSELPKRCSASNRVLRAHIARANVFAQNATETRSYYKTTLIGRFVGRDIHLSSHALTVLEGKYGYDRVAPLTNDDLLLFSDIETLSPEYLYNHVLKNEHTIIEWFMSVDNDVELKLAGMHLHPAAVFHPESEDLWAWGRRRPPATIFDSVDDFTCQVIESFDDLSVHRPLAMWSTDDAFVEVKCSVCKEVFSTCSAAVRHLNSTKRCLPVYEEKLDCLSILPSLPSIALVLVSGRRIARTKADDMDEGWEVFCCVHCEVVGETFIGHWRSCIKHFHSLEHGLLPLVSLMQPFNLFRLATVNELGKYTDGDRVWACSLCHDFQSMKATRLEIMKHLTSRHILEQPSIPGDYHYAGV